MLQSIADPLMLASLFQVGGTSSGTVGLLHGPAVAPVPSLNPDSMFEVRKTQYLYAVCCELFALSLMCVCVSPTVHCPMTSPTISTLFAPFPHCSTTASQVVSSILSSTSSSFDPQRYLVECFNRLPSLSSTVDAAAVPGSVAVEGEGEAEALASAVAHARATLQEASRCIVSFSVTVMMEPDVFPRAGCVPLRGK